MRANTTGLKSKSMEGLNGGTKEQCLNQETKTIPPCSDERHEWNRFVGHGENWPRQAQES
jgi:hypothetical protein